MYKDDTCKLLSECDVGIQMAVRAIDEVLPVVESPHLRQELGGTVELFVDLGPDKGAEGGDDGTDGALQLHRPNLQDFVQGRLVVAPVPLKI